MIDKKLKEYIDSIEVAEQLCGDPKYSIVTFHFAIYIDKLIKYRDRDFLCIRFDEPNYDYVIRKYTQNDVFDVIFWSNNVNELIEKVKELLKDES